MVSGCSLEAKCSRIRRLRRQELVLAGLARRLLACPVGADKELLIALPQNRQYDYIRTGDEIEVGWDEKSGICFA